MVQELTCAFEYPRMATRGQNLLLAPDLEAASPLKAGEADTT